MRYTVVYLPDAIDHLANLWMQGPDRESVAAAANRLDEALRDDPEKRAKPFGRFHVLEDTPLAVLFEIDPDDCMVRVLSVRRFV